jgi:predicted acyl esterase
MNIIIKATASVAAITAISAGTLAVTAPEAQAASNYDCISMSEKANLRLGMTTKQVNAATHAHPWFHINDSYEGTRYAMYAYNDCRPHSGKVVMVAFRVKYDGTQHLAMTRYVAI